MTRAENLIVEGKCFFPLDDINKYKLVKELITEFMTIKNYYPMDNSHIFYQNKFLTISFFNNIDSKKTPFLESIKCSLGIKDKQDISREKYFRGLNQTREDLPLQITFYIIPSKQNERDGFLIHIRSEPIVLFKMRSLNYRPIYDEFEYSNIIETNKQFINEIMFGLPNGKVIEKPKALSEVINTPFIDLLKNKGFEKISTLLKQGSTKLERGDIEDGLTDLRSALEQFIKELVQKIGENPQDNIPSNLDILKKNGYIDEHLHSLIKNSLYEWIYKHISNTCVHKREKISMNDAKLLFSISEIIMNYLIEKVVYRR
jgi:hypothetical protein